MKLKSLIIKRFYYQGTEIPDVEIFFEPSVKEITIENFDPVNDDFYISQGDSYRINKYIKQLSDWHSW